MNPRRHIASQGVAVRLSPLSRLAPKRQWGGPRSRRGGATGARSDEATGDENQRERIKASGHRSGSPRRVVLACAVSVCLASLGDANASTKPDGPGRGQLIGLTDRGPMPMPLAGTEVFAHVSGESASVTVKQKFRNPNAKPVEAIYVFPLPDSAAVHHFEIKVRDEVVRGQVRLRADAVQLYGRAKKSGKVAALLEQERPNIFTQSLANVFPKSEVEVELRYDVPVRYVDGAYEFVFPLVVGPRHIPGDPNNKPTLGWGESADTDEVPDASRITPPTAAANSRSGRNIKISLALRPGAPLRELYSPTHTIRTTPVGKPKRGAVRVELANKNEIPNRDFVIRYRTADRRPAIGFSSYKDRRGGFFTLRFDPPRTAPPTDPTAKELVLVADASLGMKGAPLAQLRAALRAAIAGLKPNDTFELIGVGSRVRDWKSGPVANSEKNRARAYEWIDGLVASGETDLRGALGARLVGAPALDRMRIVMVMTTGLVGNDDAVLRVVATKRGAGTRVFALGLGAAPNRSLLERMAQLGHGAAEYVLPNEPIAAQVTAYLERIGSPVLTDIKVDWKGLAVEDVRPVRTPDLFAGRPMSLVGRFSRAGRATIEVRGRIGGRRVVYQVPVHLTDSESESVARQWARRKVHELELNDPASSATVERVADLGLRFQLVTQQTAFVAIAAQARVGAGDLQTIVVPVAAPAQDKPETVTNGRDIAPVPAAPPPTDVQAEKEDRAPEKTARSKDATRRDEPEENAEVGDGLNVGAGAVDGDVDDDDDDEGDGDGDGDDDDASDESDDPAPRVAAEAAISSGRSFDNALTARDGIGIWRFRLGIGVGLTSGAIGGESSLASSIALGIDRTIVGRFALGAELAMLVRGPDEDRVIGNLYGVASYRDLLHGALGSAALDLSLGTGPAASENGVGLGVTGALKLRVPLPVSIQLRYDASVRFGQDEGSSGTLTTGFEFSF